MVKRIADTLYEGLSPVEQACVHHLAMRPDYVLPNGVPLPFAESGLSNLRTSTLLNLFSADPEVGYGMLSTMYGNEAAKISGDIQELLICTVDESVPASALASEVAVRRALCIINPFVLTEELKKKERIEIINAFTYPKFTDNLGWNAIAISDKYRLQDEDKIKNIMALYR